MVGQPEPTQLGEMRGEGWWRRRGYCQSFCIVVIHQVHTRHDLTVPLVEKEYESALKKEMVDGSKHKEGATIVTKRF